MVRGLGVFNTRGKGVQRVVGDASDADFDGLRQMFADIAQKHPSPTASVMARTKQTTPLKGPGKHASTI